MEFLTNKIGYSTRVSYFICTITYQQHYVCEASAPYVRSINTICANLQHIHEEQIMGDVIAKEHIGLNEANKKKFIDGFINTKSRLK